MGWAILVAVCGLVSAIGAGFDGIYVLVVAIFLIVGAIFIALDIPNGMPK